MNFKNNRFDVPNRLPLYHVMIALHRLATRLDLSEPFLRVSDFLHQSSGCPPYSRFVSAQENNQKTPPAGWRLFDSIKVYN